MYVKLVTGILVWWATSMFNTKQLETRDPQLEVVADASLPFPAPIFPGSGGRSAFLPFITLLTKWRRRSLREPV